LILHTRNSNYISHITPSDLIQKLAKHTTEKRTVSLKVLHLV